MFWRKATTASVEIIGIVAPSGPGAVQVGQGAGAPPDEPWTFSVTLLHWRTADGTIVHYPLRLTKTIPNRESRTAIDALFAAIKPETIMGFEIAALPGAAPANESAELIKPLNVVMGDAELSALLADLKRVVAFEDVVGTFVLDRRFSWFATQPDANGVMRIAFAADIDAARNIVELARASWQSADNEWCRQIKQFAARQLLSLAQTWQQDAGKPKPTEESFQDVISVENIGFHPDGTYDVHFSDGDLFWGHSIVVTGSLASGPKHANIEG